MEITRDTRDHLILEHTPWEMGGLFTLLAVSCAAGALMAGHAILWVVFAIVLAIGSVMVRRTMVVFDRNTGVVDMRMKSVTGYSSHKLPLAEFEKAEVERIKGEESDTYRVRLRFGGDTTVPLNAVADWKLEEHEFTADRINRWCAQA